MAGSRRATVAIDYDGTVQQVVQSESSSSSDSSSGSTTYTVVSGDTLWAIAKAYLGSGSRYTEIYDANADVIEATAKAHGKTSSSNGHWIWPGTVLTIPGTSSESTTGGTATVVTVGTSNPALGEALSGIPTSFTYTDVASGESDSMSLVVADVDRDWFGSDMPSRGASFGAAIELENWESEGDVREFDCGTFILDDFTAEGGTGTTCTFGCVSVPAMDDFKSLPVTETFEDMTIEEIASQKCAAAGIFLVYDADTIQIAEVEQNDQTDSAFLYSLCEKYGLGMKVYNKKVVIFDIVAYEAKSSVATIDESGMLSWDYSLTVEGTYTGVSLCYTDPDDETSINVFMGEEGRTYFIDIQASSQYDAELQAAATVNAANRNMETLSVTMHGTTGFVATQCVEITGLKNINGKYYIDQIKHTLSSSGYKMVLTLHRVQDAIIVTAPVESSTSGGTTYTVVSGDTLWAIAQNFYGSGSKYYLIYDANVDVIEATAKQYGKTSSSNGHWIYPGTVLTIPTEE